MTAGIKSVDSVMIELEKYRHLPELNRTRTVKVSSDKIDVEGRDVLDTPGKIVVSRTEPDGNEELPTSIDKSIDTVMIEANKYRHVPELNRTRRSKVSALETSGKIMIDEAICVNEKEIDGNEEQYNTIDVRKNDDIPDTSGNKKETKAYKVLRKSAVLVVGGMIIGVGLVLIPLPIPFGAIIVCSGVAVIGTEFDKAKNLIDNVIGRLHKARCALRKKIGTTKSRRPIAGRRIGNCSKESKQRAKMTQN